MLTCGVIITSGGLRLYYLYCIGPCCKPVHIYWCYYTLLLKGSQISVLIASMSDCTVCRLESIFVIGGFRVGYCSCSIYLYIGDVVLRVGSFTG